VNPELKIVFVGQHGSALANSKKINPTQWKTIVTPLDDPQKQAIREARSGLSGDIPSLVKMCVFAVASDENTRLKANEIVNETVIPDEIKKKIISPTQY